MNELQLQTGPYKTTFVGTEIIRPSTKEEWVNYGEILKRVDEAKQWAIGDWLVDGKSHYGDGLYKKASEILDIPQGTLQNLKSISDQFEISRRREVLNWAHHYEIASIKLIKENENGKAYLSDESDHDKIREFLKKAEKDNLSVRALRELVQQHKIQQNEYIRLANEPEKYSIWYADPPWKYNDELMGANGHYGPAMRHYSSMTIQELCDLPVKKRVADNAVLFLWVTSPLLKECWPVIKAWGFEYKTSFVWDKMKHNYGHYNSVRHEFLLVCTRGSYLPQIDELFDSVVSIERSDNHSEKPEQFREIIDKLYPTGKRIELFTRRQLPEHWENWGDEK